MPDNSEVEDRYVATAWGQGDSSAGAEDLTMPSGQVALVRRIGMEGLITEGVITNFNMLTNLVDEKHLQRVTPSGRKTTNKDASDPLRGMDPEQLVEAMHMVDRIVCAVVVKPEVTMTPGSITNRKSGVIYCDMIDLTDRMFIFNYTVGGTRDVERFRKESGINA